MFSINADDVVKFQTWEWNYQPSKPLLIRKFNEQEKKNKKM